MQGESNSITNQRRLLEKVAAEMGYKGVREYIDDGISGTTFDRPAFIKMTEDISDGQIEAVLVKDMSRLGRDYLKVGHFTDLFFPENNVRFIAVNDGVDSNNGEDEFLPIRNIMNEWYARDVSRKVKAANRARGMSGEPLGLPPYGYMADPNGTKRWVVDEEAALVVRRIFEMGLSGMGTDQIADTLSSENILTPLAYWMSKGQKRRGRYVPKSPFTWSPSTIGGFFKAQEYCGDVINFKTVSKSYRSRKRVPNDPENMVVFKDVHEPIISREDFERLQAKRVNITRKRSSPTRRNIFTGIVRCPDCGANLTFNINSRNRDITFYKCKNYQSGTHVCSSTHYVRVDFLEKVVLADIRHIMKLVRVDENLLVKNLTDVAVQDLEGECKALRQSIDALKVRDAEARSPF